MNTPQTAILPEHMSACIVIEADVADITDLKAFKAACAQSADILDEHLLRYAEAATGLCIGFGRRLWTALGHTEEGSSLKDFYPLGNGLAPATQHDIAIHIQSRRHYANLALACELLQLFGATVRVTGETHGFRQYEERGLEGFVDGTENPKGGARIPYGMIAEGNADAGGSYLLLQKYVHDLEKWQQLPVSRQEAAVGRTKADNAELEGSARLPDSHLGRVDLKENGTGLKILRQSLPFGTASGDKGLMFIAYCAFFHNLEQQLLSMFGETDGKTDLLLSTVSRAVSGSYYYVPPMERLQAL